jgi:hypothetical protein
VTGQAAPRGKHDLDPDPELREDFSGRKVCRACGLMGKPGDARHRMRPAPRPRVPAGPPPTPDAARELDARILGERDG